MKDRPIVMSAPMVRALIEGRKHQTRRVIKADIGEMDRPFMMDDGSWHVVDSNGCNMSPIDIGFAAGDRLWVREILQRFNRVPPTAQYAATLTGVPAPPSQIQHVNGAALWQWQRRSLPSIHMPRWASRLTLAIKNVRVERLQMISEADAVAEGVEFRENCWGTWNPDGTMRCGGSGNPREAFRCLWINLHGTGAWDRNPWVAVLTFRTVLGNIDEV